jgi:transposase InsO family protein
MDEKDVIIPEAAPAPLSEEDLIRRDEWAQFRLGLISSVVFNTHDRRSERQELIRISGRCYKGPDGTMVKCSYQTLCRWVRSYRDKGIAGLYTKKRSDSGGTRVLSLEVQVRIQEILKAVPSIRIAKLGRRLVEEGLLKKGDVSDDTLRRFVLAHDLRNPAAQEERIRRSFLVRETGFLWESDSLYFIKIRKKGKLHWVFIQGIIDDHSRLIVAARCYWQDNARNFQDTFRSAVARWNVPVKLYADNGSPFIDRQLLAICNRLGVTLIHTRSRDGASKGAVERSWLSMLIDTIPDIILDEVDTIGGLQDVVDRYVDAYNTKVNTGVGGIPVERYRASAERIVLRRVESSEELSAMFMNEDRHSVYNDNTIRKWNRKWEIPDDLVTQLRKRKDKKVNVHYDPHDREKTIHVIYQEKKYPLTLHDPYANDGKKRNTGGRKTELAEKAKEKEEKKMSLAEARAEARYARRMAGVDPRYLEDEEDLVFPDPVEAPGAAGDLVLDLSEVGND